MTGSVLLLSIAGCESFLDKDPQGSLTQATFPTSASDALLAVNATYGTMLNASFHSGLFPLLDIMSDDGRKGSNPTDQSTEIGPYDSFTFPKTGNELSSWWATVYQGIKRANVVIEKVPEIQEAPAGKTDEEWQVLRSRYVAEAKFFAV